MRATGRPPCGGMSRLLVWVSFYILCEILITKGVLLLDYVVETAL